MVTKLIQVDVHNNSSNFRCSNVIMTYYNVIYLILLAEKISNQYLYNDSIYNQLLAVICLIRLLCLTIVWLSLATVMTSL